MTGRGKERKREREEDGKRGRGKERKREREEERKRRREEERKRKRGEEGKGGVAAHLIAQLTALCRSWRNGHIA